MEDLSKNIPDKTVNNVSDPDTGTIGKNIAGQYKRYSIINKIYQRIVCIKKESTEKYNYVILMYYEKKNIALKWEYFLELFNNNEIKDVIKMVLDTDLTDDKEFSDSDKLYYSKIEFYCCNVKENESETLYKKINIGKTSEYKLYKNVVYEGEEEEAEGYVKEKCGKCGKIIKRKIKQCCL